MNEETVSLPVSRTPADPKCGNERPGTANLPGYGRKPANGHTAMTNAERQARFKQAKRDAEAQRLREEAEARAQAAQERERQARLRVDVRRAAGKLLDSLPRDSSRFTSALAGAGWKAEDFPEARQCLDELISGLISGNQRLP